MKEPHNNVRKLNIFRADMANKTIRISDEDYALIEKIAIEKAVEKGKVVTLTQALTEILDEVRKKREKRKQ